MTNQELASCFKCACGAGECWICNPAKDEPAVEPATVAMQLFASAACAKTGQVFKISASSVERIAAECSALSELGYDVSSVRVSDAAGSVRGWAHPDGTWTAQ